MLSRRIFILIFTFVSLAALTGCPPKKNSKEKIRTGRTGLSPTGVRNANGTVSSYNPANPGTVWGGVSASDGNFQNAINIFAMAAGLSGNETMGTVSPQPGASGGIYFWGTVETRGGQVVSGNSRIHIEVFDDKAVQGIVPQLFVHVGPEQEGFKQAYGNRNNEVIFEGSPMSIKMLFQNYGGTQLTGIMYFYNNNVPQYLGTNDWVPLGTFTVQSTGFFIGN